MFTKYVVTTLKKYPGIIFQKFIHKFGKSVEVPEIRQYWVGREYQFSMIATQRKIYCLSGEGHKPLGRKQNGMMRLPKGANLEVLKDIARKVMEVLQSKITLTSPDGVTLPLLMTRVDMGVMRDGVFNPWVNEVEYVPSYYVEDHTHPIEGTVAEQCAVIAKKFLGMENDGKSADFEKSCHDLTDGNAVVLNCSSLTESLDKSIHAGNSADRVSLEAIQESGVRLNSTWSTCDKSMDLG